MQPTPRRRFRRGAAAAVATIMAASTTFLAPGTADAEINPRGETTWGVYGIDTNTQSNAIQNLVFAIEQIGDRIYVGGKFLEARPNANGAPVNQPYLAAFDANTGNLITTFTPQLESAVYSLQASPDGTRLYVGGEFRSINGDNEARGLAALDPITGNVDTTWRAKVWNQNGARGMVHSLTISGNQLYLGGRFDRIGGGPRPIHATDKVARVALSNGVADTTLAPDIDGGAVWGVAVAPDGGRIYLAGYHDTVDGDPAGADYTVLDAADGALDVAMSDVGGNSVNPDRRYGQDVVAVGDYVFWGGSEHVLRVFRASDGALVREHSTDRGGDYQDIEVVGDRVYASCHCYTNHFADYDYWPGRGGPIPGGVLTTPIRYVAAYSATTGEYLPSFTLDASATRSGVWAIHGDDDGCLWVGGDISRITALAGNDRAAGGFAQFCDDGAGGGSEPTTPGDPVQTRSEQRKIVIRWNTSTDDDEVDFYEISRDGVLVGTKDDIGAGRYWYVDPGLTPATNYDYQVVAVDIDGNRSAAATVTASTIGAPVDGPDAPTGLRSTRRTRERIVLNWVASPDAVSYVIQRNDGAGFVEIGTSTSRWETDLGLDAGTAYTYRVIAVAADGAESAPSIPLNVSTQP